MKKAHSSQFLKTSRIVSIVGLFVLIFGGLTAAGLYVRSEHLKYSEMTNGSDSTIVPEEATSTPDAENNTDTSAPNAPITPPGTSDENAPAGALNPVEDFSAGDIPEPEESASYSVVYQEGYSQPVLQLADIGNKEFALETVN